MKNKELREVQGRGAIGDLIEVQSLLDVLDDIDVPGALCLDVLYPNPDGRGPLQGSGYLLNDEV